MIGVSASVAWVVLTVATTANISVWDSILSGSKDLIEALGKYDVDRLGGPLTGTHCPGFTYHQLLEFETVLEVLRGAEIDSIHKVPIPSRIDERSQSELLKMQCLLQLSSRVASEGTVMPDPFTDDSSVEIVSPELVEEVAKLDFVNFYSVLRHLLVLGLTKTWNAIFVSNADRIVDHVLAVASYGPDSTRKFVQSALADSDDAFITKLLLRALHGAFIQRLASILVAFDPQIIIRCTDQFFKDEDAEIEGERYQQRFLFLSIAARMAQLAHDHQQNQVLEALFERHLDKGHCVLAMSVLARDIGADKLEMLVNAVSEQRKSQGLTPVNAYMIEAMAASRHALSPTPCFEELADESWLRSSIKNFILAEATTGFDRIIGIVSIDEFSSILNKMIRKMIKEETFETGAPKVIRAVADLGMYMSSLSLSHNLWEIVDRVPENDDQIVATLYEAVAIAYSRAELDSNGKLPAFFDGYTASSIHNFNSYDVLKFVSDKFWLASLTAVSRMPMEHVHAVEPVTQRTLLEILLSQWYEDCIPPEQRSLYFSHIELLTPSLLWNENAWKEFVLRNFMALFEDDDLQARLLLFGLTPQSKQEAIQRLVSIISPFFLSEYDLEQLDSISEKIYGMVKDSGNLVEYLIRYLCAEAREHESTDQLRVAGQIASLAAPTLGDILEAELFLELVRLQTSLDLDSDDDLALTHEFYCAFSQQTLQSAFKSIILEDPEWTFDVAEIRDRMKPEALAECRQDFADLDPPLWAQIFGPVLLNGLRAEFLAHPHLMLSYWLPTGPRRNEYLAEVVLSARHQSRDLLFELMTDPDFVYLLRYLCTKPDKDVLRHQDLLLESIEFVLNHRFSLKSKLFLGHELDRHRLESSSVLWPILERIFKLNPILPDRLVSIFTTSNSLKIELDKLKLLTDVVYLSSDPSVQVFKAVLKIISKLPSSALDRIVFRHNILTYLLLHGPQDAPYAFITPIIAKMSPDKLGDVVLALANRAAQFAVDERSWSSLREFSDANVPDDLRSCLKFAAVSASVSEVDRVQRILVRQYCRKRKPMVVVSIIPVLSNATESIIQASAMRSKKFRIA